MFHYYVCFMTNKIQYQVTELMKQRQCHYDAPTKMLWAKDLLYMDALGSDI